MTIQQMYKECERLYAQVNWNNRESIHRYNEAVRELRKQRDQEEEESMNKAKWVRTDYGKGYNAGWVYRTYEYRGEIYVTEENQKKGNAIDEQIWMQHKREQKRIDEKLDSPKQEPEWLTPEEEAAQKAAWDEIWAMLGMEV